MRHPSSLQTGDLLIEVKANQGPLEQQALEILRGLQRQEQAGVEAGYQKTPALQTRLAM